MSHPIAACAFAVFMTLLSALPSSAATRRWSVEEIDAWYADQRWLVGANYVPANAINQLEMWQADTFDPATIDEELGWAAAIGMNTMRVFLHDLLWVQDSRGFERRIDTFLDIAARRGIKPIFVFFDSCWDPDPRLGPQRPPIPGVHNSGWVQSPGRAGLADPTRRATYEAYVKGILRRFGRDSRILAWDLWNEPDNVLREGPESPEGRAKIERVTTLLPQVFAWARAADPSQPLTSGVWRSTGWPSRDALSAIERTQLERSDFISFHSYDWPEACEAKIEQLRSYQRPIVVTEYLARGAGSTVDTTLPIARRHGVGLINWGLVVGRTQTQFPWDSWLRPYVASPPIVWHHDLLRPDGRPYRQAEVDQIRSAAREAQAELDARLAKRRKAR